MLITDLDGSRAVCVSQIAPGSNRNSDKPCGSCEKSWHCWVFVVAVCHPPSVPQNDTPGQCLCALSHHVISLLCPHSSLCHSSVLWAARINFLMSLGCHLSPQSTNLQLPTLFPATSLLCYSHCLRASNPKQREKKIHTPLVQC